MTDHLLLTIGISEIGEVKSIRGEGNLILETSETLLNSLLGNPGTLIGEFRTIILIKLVRPDEYWTWFIKDPPEYRFCPCIRCSCRSAHHLNQESLWISPKDDLAKDGPAYLTLRITQDGEIQAAQARSVALEELASLLEQPLNLGDVAIGGFQIITLIKLTRSDDSYTWVIRHPVAMEGVDPAIAGCRYTYTAFYQPAWIKPEGASPQA